VDQQWSLLDGRLRYLLRASRTRQELERSKSKLARAQDLARMGSFDWRWSGGLVLSPEALRVFGLGPSDPMTLRACCAWCRPRTGGCWCACCAACAARLGADDRHAGDAQLVQRRPCRARRGRARVQRTGQMIGYTGVVQDVTDRRVAEDKIRHLANFDALTGLPNRRQLLWRAERALEMARRLGHQSALLLIDLDRFKIINDTLGHQSGDELLMEVARRLRGCVRTLRPDPGSGVRRPWHGRALAPQRWKPWAAWAATSSWPCCPRWPTNAMPNGWRSACWR
jgi:hypothetical protein